MTPPIFEFKKNSLFIAPILFWGAATMAALPSGPLSSKSSKVTLGSDLKEIASQLAGPEVRVRLESAQKTIEIIGKDIRVQGKARQLTRVSLGAEASAEKIKISNVVIAKKSFWKVDHFEGKNTRTELISEPLLELEGHNLLLGKTAAKNFTRKALPQKIFLALNKTKIDLIGVLPLERYLVGVLASEMPLRWPEESLKAQAIAARSYSLAVMKERSGQLFQLESSIKDQVFRHVSSGIDFDPLIQRAFEAVKATEGKVLMTKQNTVMKAFYHADCGGSTSSAKSVWGFGDSSGGAVDDSCPLNPSATWTLQLSQRALTEKLSQVLNLTSRDILVASIEPKKLTHGLRAEAIEVALSNGQREVILADTFRAKVGYGVLKSTLFEVQKTQSQNETEFHFKGRGFGHGVGLCQWGSRQMAASQKTYQDILKHYYPQAELR